MPDEPRRVRTQVERDADGTAWRYHEHGERISDAATDRPLPPVPDCCYPTDAGDLPEPRPVGGTDSPGGTRDRADVP